MPAKTVLVTGANGYLASAVILHFLEHGYSVRGTVRSLSKAEMVKGFLFPKYEAALSFVVVEDMTKDGAYEAAGALQAVDAVCHVATPVPDIASLGRPAAGDDVDWVRDMVEPAKAGTLTILRAASRVPSVQHVIITSSASAVRTVPDPKDPTARLTEADWNTARAEDAANRHNAFAAYIASKTEAERAVWSYAEEAKPHFTIATFCPPIVFGPAAIRARRLEEFGSTLQIFYRLMQGEKQRFPFSGPAGGSYVDVRDMACAFRLVIEKPLREHQRFLLAAGAINGEEVVAFSQSLNPAVLHETPAVLDSSKARQLLGWTPRPKAETFLDMAAYLKEAEKAFSH